MEGRLKKRKELDFLLQKSNRIQKLRRRVKKFDEKSPLYVLI